MSSYPWTRPMPFVRIATLVLAGAMATVATLTVRHFFDARFPTSMAQAAACQADSFFSCGSSATSSVAALLLVPIGYFGLALATFLALAAAFATPALERTARALASLNALLALALVGYSLAVLRALCLLCTSYAALSVVVAVALARGRLRPRAPAGAGARASWAHLVAFAVITAVGAAGARAYHQARLAARSGDEATRIVHQYFALDSVRPPSTLAATWTVRSTARFGDAPIRIVEFGDLLCPDCRFFAQQMRRLEREFPGRINVVFQPFPLEARCNSVVEKDKHPGACELAYIASYRPERFAAIHDEVFAHMEDARRPEWRAALARRFGVEAALGDSATHARVRQLIGTGAEYERTSDTYAHGIRSTPTLLLNDRMIIGTLPDEQMRAICQAILDQRSGRGKRFIEHWVE